MNMTVKSWIRQLLDSFHALELFILGRLRFIDKDSKQDCRRFCLPRMTLNIASTSPLKSALNAHAQSG